MRDGIGVAALVLLIVADVIRYFADSEEFDGVMMIARPVVVFIAVSLMGAHFLTAIMWTILWGAGGLYISFELSERRSAGEEKDAVKPAPPKPEPPKPEPPKPEPPKPSPPKPSPPKPEPPRPSAEPVYRDDIFYIEGTKIRWTKVCHPYLRIPEGITEIGRGAFSGHKHIRGVILPDSLRIIGKEAFRNCIQLEEIVLPEGLEIIEEYAFYRCKSLRKIRFPKSLKKADKSAFAYCSKLAEAHFPEGCAAELGVEVFSSCKSLREVIIPSGVKIRKQLVVPFFEKGKKDLAVRCSAGSDAYFEAKRAGVTCTAPDGRAYDTAGDFLIEDGVLKSYTGCDPEVTVPEGVRAIEAKVFSDNEYIEQVTLPDSVTSLGAGAFYNCRYLRHIKLPVGLTAIERDTFYWCNSLSQIIWPKNLTTIRARAFQGVRMQVIRLPDSLKYIGAEAFAYSSRWREIHIPPSAQLADSALAGCKDTTVITRPGSRVAAFAAEKGIPVCTSPGKTANKIPPRSEDLPGNIRRTYYETLRPEEKIVYSELMKAILNREERFDLRIVEEDKVRMYEVQEAMDADLPEIYWVKWDKIRDIGYLKGDLKRVYAITKEQQDRMQQQIDALVQPFLRSIPRHWGDYEKAKRAFKWVMEKLSYDRVGLDLQKERKYESDTVDDLRNIYGAFVKKKVVCVGYAKAFTYLMHAMGIECVMRTGGRSLDRGHAWACVKLEGDFYHVDVTWADEMDGNDSYRYFCVTDDDMYRYQGAIYELVDHIKCDAVRCSYYAKEGLYMDRLDEHTVMEAIRKAYARDGRVDLPIKFTDMYLMELTQDRLDRNEELRTISKASGYASPRLIANRECDVLRVILR